MRSTELHIKVSVTMSHDLQINEKPEKCDVKRTCKMSYKATKERKNE